LSESTKSTGKHRSIVTDYVRKTNRRLDSANINLYST